MSNSNSDSFFKEEELSGENTLIQDLEIELEAEKLVKEAKYKFRVKNIGIDRDVNTPYGLKNKLIIEYHIKAFIDDEEISYDLKQKYNISNSSKSKFYQVHRDLTGKAPIGKINLRNLLGIKGVCEVKHLELDNGDIFPQIVNINSEIRNEVAQY